MGTIDWSGATQRAYHDETTAFKTLGVCGGIPNFTNIIGVFGEQQSADIRDHISEQFHYNISTSQLDTVTTNGGTVTSEDDMAKISSGTNVNGTAELTSKASLRYRAGHTAICHITVRFDEPYGVEDVTQYCGLLDDHEGIFFGFNGTTFQVAYRNADVDTVATSDEFNGNVFSRLNLANVNIFRIMFGWLGVAPIVFQVFAPDTQQWETMHIFKTGGNIATPHIGNPAIPMRVQVEKTDADATDVVVYTACWHAGILGFSEIAGSRSFADEQTATDIDGTATLVAVWRNPTTFQGVDNHVRADLLKYAFYIDPVANGTGTIRFRLLGDPTLSGTPSWTDVDATNSVIQYDTVQTYVSGGKLVLTEWIAYSNTGSKTSVSSSIDASQFNLFLRPGSTMALVVDRVNGTQTPDVRAAFNWSERF